MRSAVHVQHLPGNVAGLGEVNNGVHEVADAGDCTHRRERLQEALRFVRVHWSVDNAGRYGVEANVFLCILDRQAASDGFNAALSILLD